MKQFFDQEWIGWAQDLLQPMITEAVHSKIMSMYPHDPDLVRSIVHGDEHSESAYEQYAEDIEKCLSDEETWAPVIERVSRMIVERLLDTDTAEDTAEDTHDEEDDDDEYYFIECER